MAFSRKVLVHAVTRSRFGMNKETFQGGSRLAREENALQLITIYDVTFDHSAVKSVKTDRATCSDGAHKCRRPSGVHLHSGFAIYLF